MNTRTKVKICCIASQSEAKLAIEAGADAIGLVAEMPSGPGPIPDEAIETIARIIPPGVDSFLLTSRTSPTSVLEQVLRCRASVVQLVGTVESLVYQHLRKHAPNVRIVQVIHVEDINALSEAQRIASDVDAILLDFGHPSAPVPELGGTGRVHDWNISKVIVSAVSSPVFLAGGLTPDNVSDAIRTVQPYGVDLCSSVRTNGALDIEKLKRFMDVVRAADATN
ncbi:MAG: phosphoribosylanthranilate isomerase [Merismopedia sp. SIO2A8]|nr:phosphoribosylanthranilate isomerase [Merismopedia sp. SIO2A8]